MQNQKFNLEDHEGNTFEILFNKRLVVHSQFKSAKISKCLKYKTPEVSNTNSGVISITEFLFFYFILSKEGMQIFAVAPVGFYKDITLYKILYTLYNIWFLEVNSAWCFDIATMSSLIKSTFTQISKFTRLHLFNQRCIQESVKHP